jgi:hypothetical protein
VAQRRAVAKFHGLLRGGRNRKKALTGNRSSIGKKLEGLWTLPEEQF